MPRLMIFGGGPRRIFTGVSGIGTALATFNFLGMSYGDEAPSRQLAIGINIGATGTNFAINSVSVDGNAASAVVNRSIDDSILKSRSAIYRLPYPTTTGGTIQVALAGSVGQCQIGVWAMYDLVTAAAAFTANNAAIDGNNTSTTIDVPAGGILLVAGHHFGANALQTLAGANTVAPDGDVNGTNAERQWGSYQAGAPETARALAFNGGGGTNAARTLVAASWS